MPFLTEVASSKCLERFNKPGGYVLYGHRQKLQKGTSPWCFESNLEAGSSGVRGLDPYELQTPFPTKITL